MKTALVLGAGGFIGSHLVERLKKEGYWVRGVDLKYPEFSKTAADHFVIADLRDSKLVEEVMSFAGSRRNPFEIFAQKVNFPFDEVYQLAADMGGAGYIFTGEHDADIMHNSATINLNVAHHAVNNRPGKLFYSSSACIYPAENQLNPEDPNCKESSAYPANPDSDYGWEKLFSERMFMAFARNHGLNIRVGRYHNIFGPKGSWISGREKAPAAICRKVAMAKNDEEIEIWGDGEQTRSFMYIDECIEATRRFMNSDFTGPVNIGSEEMVTINQLAEMAIRISGKYIRIKHVAGPTGVRGRNSHNDLFKEKIGWETDKTLEYGMKRTYAWINSMCNN